MSLSEIEPYHTNRFENNQEFTYINNDKEDRKTGQVMENSKSKCYTFEMMSFFCTPQFSTSSLLPVTHSLVGR